MDYHLSMNYYFPQDIQPQIITFYFIIKFLIVQLSSKKVGSHLQIWKVTLLLLKSMNLNMNYTS